MFLNGGLPAVLIAGPEGSHYTEGQTRGCAVPGPLISHMIAATTPT